jgi:four helix bundle protein
MNGAAVAKITSFRDLEAWQASMAVAESCYRLTKRFPPSEQYGLIIQMRRAAVSVASNVAEGHRRTRPGFVHHLQIGLGSLAELETQLELAIRLEFVSADEAELLHKSLVRAGQLLHALLRSLKAPLS